MTSKKIKFFITFFIIFTLFCLIILTMCNNKTNILERDATNNDISINTSEEISLNIKYTLIPYTDISNLELTFKYVDSNSNHITTKVKTVGNVKEGIQYTISVSLAEFSLLDLLKISHAKVSVTNGKVSYI